MTKKMLLRGALAALPLALALALSAAPNALAITPTVHYYGGPIMSSERWVEVIWGAGLSSENPTLPTDVASYLTDDAAASGETTNAFAVLTQYSTAGISGGSSQIAAYDQSFAGSTQITPSKCATATTCSLLESDVEAELNSQIAAGQLPSPSGEGLSTAYLVLFPESVTITDNYSTVSAQQWCSEYGATKLTNSSTHLLFAMLPDLGANSGCGQLSTRNENMIVQVSHQQHELITDPLIAESAGGEEPPSAWFNSSMGSVADICNQQTALNTINGHSWKVEKIWSNIEAECVAATSMFTAPSTGFTATPSENIATFSATGASTNHLSGIAAGIASYSWDFGDGQSGTGTAPSHAYAAAGTYTVTLTATDSLGFTAQATHEVTVSAPPSPPNTGGSGAGSGGSTGGSTSNTGGPTIATVGSSGGGSSNTVGASGAGAKASVAPVGSASTASSGGTILVNSGETAQCPSAGGLCVVSIEAEVETASLAKTHKPSTRKLNIGSGSLTISPGASAKLTFKLNSTGRRLLRTHGHLLVKLTITIHHASEAPVVSTHTLRIAAPKRPAHK